jgi:hypothetical protein
MDIPGHPAHCCLVKTPSIAIWGWGGAGWGGMGWGVPGFIYLFERARATTVAQGLQSHEP